MAKSFVTICRSRRIVDGGFELGVFGAETAALPPHAAREREAIKASVVDLMKNECIRRARGSRIAAVEPAHPALSAAWE
jgi:hypothetical protein